MRKVYTIEGLDCANCAAKLEKKMNEHPGVFEAVLTFATQQLCITAENPDELLPELQAIADRMEEGVVIKERVRGKKAVKREHHHEHGEHYHHEHGEECHCGEHEHHHEHERHHHHEHGEECHCGEHEHHHEHEEHEHHHQEDAHLSVKGEDALHDKKEKKLPEHAADIMKLGAGVVLFLCAIGVSRLSLWEGYSLILYVAAYVVLGAGVVITALKNIGKGQVFDENFLMSIATIGAFIIGEYPEAVGVMLFYMVGELFEEIAVSRSRKQIMEAADLRPEVVNLIGDTGEIKVIDADEAELGNVILVRPGDRIPLDGTVVEGESRIDTSPITGEPVPVSVRVGSELLSGCVNESGVIKMRVTKELSDSMVTRILDSVENAAASKPKLDRFITRFARVYTPFVVILAVLTAVVPSLITGNWSHWIYTALTFLVISCPCALVLSVPLAFFAGIGAGSKQGILFKGGVSLEALKDIKAVVMDKTGTITEGNFNVQKSVAVDGVDENRLIALAAACEINSTHPIGISIVERFHALDNTDVQMGIKRAVSIEEVAGKGIKAVFEDGTALCGNRALLEQENVSLEAYDMAMKRETMAGSEVLLSWNGQYMGYLLIADTIKKESAKAVRLMNQRGLTTAMLTGDAPNTADAIAKETGIGKVYAKCLPDDKVQHLIELREACGSVMFIGDGINDAPVLAGADVGAAMGSGADAAIEAADVVFMNSSLMAVPEALRIAKKACRVSKQNVIFSLVIKAAVMVLGLCGIASMWMAVFADSGVAMLCVLNSVRVLRVKKQMEQ